MIFRAPVLPVRVPFGAKRTWGWQPGRLSRWLVAARVPFVAIGGTAVACYVPDRRPDDLDILILPSPQAAHRAIRALRMTVRRCGLVPDGAMVVLDEAALRQGRELIVSLKCGKLHVIGEQLPNQVDAESVIARRQWWLVDRSVMPICARDDLIAIKLANACPKDLDDISMLTSVPTRPTRKRPHA